MGRSIALHVVSDTEDDDFDIASQIAIVRRAMAEVEIPSNAHGLGLAYRELTRLATLAEKIVSAAVLSELSDDSGVAKACSKALFGVQDGRRSLERLRASRPSRVRLETIRRKLHAVLATLGEALAHTEHASTDDAESDLERALRVRHLVSDFYGAIPWQANGSASRAWALLVANAELRILLKGASFGRGLDAHLGQLAALRERIAGWQAKRPDPVSTSRLYTELLGVSSVLSSLSARPEVKRHDDRALLELSALLAHRNFDDRMAERAVDVLCSLRGMDCMLDRLIVALPLDPRRVLKLVLRRVTELRARSLPS